MRIEAVTVCVNYDDFLEPAIRANMPLFDDWVVITKPEDRGTHAVCERYGVRAVDCSYFHKSGAKFDKARAINLGLAHLTCSEWILHLDADIILPRDTRHQLVNIELDPLCIYGIDRVDCPSWEAYQAHLTTPNPWQKHYFVATPNDWHKGTRLRHHDFGGYVPIGYFQLWHRKSGITRYPIVHDGDAEHTDVLHGLQWPRPRRVLIPEVLGIHLTTGGPIMGSNWKGRTTPRFAPAEASVAAAAARPCPHHGRHYGTIKDTV